MNPVVEQTGIPKVLIIEDTSVWQDILKRTLGEQNYELTLAATYQEAIQRLEHVLFDVVVVDIYLPDRDDTVGMGRIIVSLVRATKVFYVQRPQVVVVSGLADSSLVRDLFMEYEVFDFVSKQRFDPATFRTVVRNAAQVEPSISALPDSVCTQALTYGRVYAGIGRLKQILKQEAKANTLVSLLDVALDYHAEHAVLREAMFHVSHQLAKDEQLLVQVDSQLARLGEKVVGELCNLKEEIRNLTQVANAQIEEVQSGIGELVKFESTCELITRIPLVPYFLELNRKVSVSLDIVEFLRRLKDSISQLLRR